MDDRVPGEDFSYSDHNAVSLEIRINAIGEKKCNQRQRSADDCFDETIIQAIKVCKEATVTIAKSKHMFLISGGILFMILLGTVGFWPNYILSDIIKIVITGLCFYYIIMGTLWNKIEMNSLKAGLSALENFHKTRNESKHSN